MFAELTIITKQQHIFKLAFFDSICLLLVIDICQQYFQILPAKILPRFSIFHNLAVVLQKDQERYENPYFWIMFYIESSHQDISRLSSR